MANVYPQGNYGGYPPPQQQGYGAGYPSQQPVYYPQQQQQGYYPQQQTGYYPQQAGYPQQQQQQQQQQRGNMPPAPPGAPVQWMQRPNGIPGCPPGLEYLAQIDRLLVKQKVDLLEAFTGWEENNRYVVSNATGQQVYFAFEKSDTCNRMCCGANRGFTIHIVDNFNQEVMRVSREFKCCAGGCCFGGCCDCCSHIVKIESPNGEVLGYVRQKWSCTGPKYHIMDANENSLYKIEGPCCVCDGAMCCCKVEFKVSDLNSGAEVGQICKEYSGFAREAFTTADNFSVSFPGNINVKTKACFLGALFLIDFMYFEAKDEDKNNRNYGYY